MAVIAADGYEQVEVSVPVMALKRAGADVRIISLRPGRLRGMNLLWRGWKIPVDETIFTARAEDYGAVYLPGGFASPDLLRQSGRVLDFLRDAERLGRPVATMCHGPQVLVSAGLVRGRQLTSWPGIADDVKNAGGLWRDKPLVREGNWVSSRGPHDFAQFIPGMLQLFEERAARGLAPLPKKVRWVATVSQVASLGLAGLVVSKLIGKLFARRRRSLALPLLAAVGGRVLERYVTAAEHSREVPLIEQQPAPSL